jgi:predicted DNA-binding transcriptional regulator AlpA
MTTILTHFESLNSYSEPSSPLLWGIEEMVKFLGMKESGVYGLVNSPGFPTPVAGKKRYRRWLPAEVMNFMTQNRPSKNLSGEVFLNSDLVTR